MGSASPYPGGIHLELKNACSVTSSFLARRFRGLCEKYVEARPFPEGPETLHCIPDA